MFVVFIAAVSILTLISPFALGYVWTLRLRDHEREEGRRPIAGWLSLTLVTLAVAVYWLSAFGSPPVATPQWDVYFHDWSRISNMISALGFILYLFGGGREKRVVLTASFIVPLSRALTKVLE
jgi:hypothetical protein